jgi:hypothetical protein
MPDHRSRNIAGDWDALNVIVAEFFARMAS